MEEKTKFGQFIVKKRKEKNLTQKKLAEQLLVTESAVSKWERGISYPDITMVSEICRVLNLTEHELITASEDVHHREVENQARYYLRILRTYEYLFYFIYGVSLITSFVCNLAIDHTLSWFFIVLTGEMVAFSVLTLPILIRNNKGRKTLVAFFLSLLALLSVCCIYTGGDWLFIAWSSITLACSIVLLPFLIHMIRLPKTLRKHKAFLCVLADTIFLLVLVTVSCIYAGLGNVLIKKAIQISLVSCSLPWIFLIIIRYIHLHNYIRTGLCLLFSGIYIFIINNIINAIIEQTAISLSPINFGNWSLEYMDGNITFIILILLILLSSIFITIGIAASNSNKGRTKWNKQKKE